MVEEINILDVILIAINAVITVIIGIVLWKLQRSLTRNEKKRDAQQARREEFQMNLLRMGVASVLLGEATAIAVKENKVNGEMDRALSCAKSVKTECREFVEKQGIRSLAEDK